MSDILIRLAVVKLATPVLPADAHDSFFALPLDAQLVGLATLAHIGGDAELRDAALELVSARAAVAAAQSLPEVSHAA